MHNHCAVEGMARKLITRLGIRPEQLLGFGGMAPGVQALSFYLAGDISQELAMCQRSDLIGMLASVVDGVSGLSDHALRIIASGLILEKVVELLCLIDEVRGGSVVREEGVTRVDEAPPDWRPLWPWFAPGKPSAPSGE